MSIPRRISPLLDGFLLGEAFHTHDAVQCFPALERRTDGKFIVKIISVPRSRVQMDALLLTGAFTSKQAANNYFKEQARAVIEDAKTLRHLATMDGFIDFDCFQVVPGADDYGFEVYLLSPYRTSLQSILEEGGLTHREAFHLAMDMANALSLARREGFLYMNLKASNVYRTEQGYCIGDLGFVSMTSEAPRLPDQYRSVYTPPELLADPTALNETSDVYQLGILLYQVYNGGVLPSPSDMVENRFAPPRNADYELAEIILRACAPTPSSRWIDPEQMAEALAQYARRNQISNSPISPTDHKQAAKTASPAAEEPSDLTPKEKTEEIEIPVPAPQPRPQKTEAPVRKQASAPKHKRKKHRFPALHSKQGRLLIFILASILLLELIFGIWVYRRNHRWHEISGMSVTGTATSLTVQISTDANENILRLLCIDSFGNIQKSEIRDGAAVFQNLRPDTRYTLRMEATDGSRLSGSTTSSFTTAPQHTILDFSAAKGTTVGSVVLSITAADGAQGPWLITWSAPGVAAQSLTFTGRSVILHDLVPGSTYNFTLSAADGWQIVGKTQFSYQVSTD